MVMILGMWGERLQVSFPVNRRESIQGFTSTFYIMRSCGIFLTAGSAGTGVIFCGIIPCYRSMILVLSRSIIFDCSIFGLMGFEV